MYHFEWLVSQPLAGQVYIIQAHSKPRWLLSGQGTVDKLGSDPCTVGTLPHQSGAIGRHGLRVSVWIPPLVMRDWGEQWRTWDFPLSWLSAPGLSPLFSSCFYMVLSFKCFWNTNTSVSLSLSPPSASPCHLVNIKVTSTLTKLLCSLWTHISLAHPQLYCSQPYSLAL